MEMRVTKNQLYQRFLRYQGEGFVAPPDLEVVYAFAKRRLRQTQHYILGFSEEEERLWMAPLEGDTVPFRCMKRKDIRSIREKYSGEFIIVRKGLGLAVRLSILRIPDGEGLYYCDQLTETDKFSQFFVKAQPQMAGQMDGVRI